MSDYVGWVIALMVTIGIGFILGDLAEIKKLLRDLGTKERDTGK